MPNTPRGYPVPASTDVVALAAVQNLADAIDTDVADVEQLARLGVPGPPGPEGSPDGAISVADHGAAGDGITDDTDAIQAAITAAGRAGGVWFPRGTYLVSSPLRPLRQQRLTGTHTVKYEPGRLEDFPGCTIAAHPNFSGRAIIDIPPSSYGVQIDRLCLAAMGTSGSFAGVALPAYADNAGENAFLIRDSMISSCPGPGITGHMWVMDVRDTHITQCSVGIHVTGDDGLTDARIIGSQFYYNRVGGIIIDSDGWTGAVTIMGCRVERSGSLYSWPEAPTNPAAPGIAIRSGRNITLIGVETDANSGPGLEIGHATRNVYNVHVVGCSFNRDGGGDQTTGSWWLGGVEVTSSTPGAVPVTGSGYAGITLDRCSHVKIVATDVAYGAADDFGAAGPISPMFGVSMQDTSGVALSLGRIEVIPHQNSLRMVGAANYGVGIDLPSLGLSTVPVVADATWLPTAGGIGCVVYQIDIGALMVRNYSGTWLRMLSYDGTNPPRFPPVVDVYGAATATKAVRMVSGDKLKALVGISADAAGADLRLERYNDDEVWQGSVTYRRATGLLETEHQYVVPATAANIAVTVRGRTSQTAALTQWETDGAVAVAGVLPSGRVWGANAVDAVDMIPLGQLKTVVDAATDFADFKTRVASM